MQCGIDIVRIHRIENLQKAGAIEKMLHPEEISGSAESIAGIVAAKEAYFKAIGKKMDWLDIRITKDSHGKPSLNLDNTSLSISHDGDYTVAMVVIF